MRDRPDPKALMRAYKACLDKIDAQARGLLPDATARELEETIWLYEDFTLSRGMTVTVSMRVGVRMPEKPPAPLRIEGPKR